MNLEGKTRGFSRRKDFIVGATLLTSLLALPGFARLQSPGNSASPGSSLETPKQSPAHVEKSPEKGNLLIPIGTILPVRLNTTISSAKNKRGKEITGRIMQGVPLSPAEKIPAGSKVLGHIVEVSPASAGQGGRVTLKFDKLIAAHRTIPITTNLRTIAGFMRVLEAQIPPVGPSESDVYDWLTTVQIGGDVVYGKGGIVTAADDPNQIVGKEVYGGVLGKVAAKEGGKCRGAISGNDEPQALWVFSHDACGTYGLEHVTIAHAGRSEPVGLIALASDKGALKIPAGAGLLLRVIE